MDFQLVLFSSWSEFVAEAEKAGIDSFIVDWEVRGKESRQRGFDTQINRETAEDLKRLRRSVEGTVWCRINRFSETTEREIDSAVSAGADEILLPMVRSVDEVEEALKLVADRTGLGILIETVEAVELAPELAKLPLSKVYMGLNDLAICRDSETIFDAIADGTVERVRAHFEIPFGFGGLTLPDCGKPIPCRLLIAEMARLEIDFSFLRRSFHRDIQTRRMKKEIPRLRLAISEARRRSVQKVEEDHEELLSLIDTRRPDWRRCG